MLMLESAINNIADLMSFMHCVGLWYPQPARKDDSALAFQFIWGAQFDPLPFTALQYVLHSTVQPCKWIYFEVKQEDASQP